MAKNSNKAFLFFFACSLLLCLPSLLNGFPLIFADSPDYLGVSAYFWQDVFRLLGTQDETVLAPLKAATLSCENAAFCHNPFYLRPLGYPLFLLPFSTNYTLYLLPLAQAALTLWILWEVFKLFILRLSPFLFAGIFLFLFLTTSFAGQVNLVMPDLFAGLFILFLVRTYGRWSSLSEKNLFFSLAFITLLLSMHLTFFPLMLFLGMVALVLDFRQKNNILRIFTLFLLPLLYGGLMISSINYIRSGDFTLSVSSPLFLQAKLLDAGPEMKYLKDICDKKSYMICAHLDKIAVPKGKTVDRSVADHFLWTPEGVRKSLHDNKQLVREAKEINRETMLAYPLWTLSSFLKDGLKQLTRFDIDRASEQYPPFKIDLFASWLRQSSQLWEKNYKKSRQYKAQIKGQLYPVAPPYSLQQIVFYASLLIILGFLFFRKRVRMENFVTPSVLILSGVFANGMITGALSTVHDRYQSRVVWLVPFLAVCLVLGEWQKRKKAA